MKKMETLSARAEQRGRFKEVANGDALFSSKKEGNEWMFKWRSGLKGETELLACRRPSTPHEHKGRLVN